MAAFTFLSRAAAQNLVVNPGFETGDLSGWTAKGAYILVSGGAMDGKYGAWLGTSGSLGILEQTLPTTAGASYDLSFYLSNTSDVPSEFRVLFDGAELYDGVNLEVLRPTLFSFDNLTASTGSTLLEFEARQDNGWFGLDDVSVTEEPSSVPEPATWACLAPLLGLGLAFLRRRNSPAINGIR